MRRIFLILLVISLSINVIAKTDIIFNKEYNITQKRIEKYWEDLKIKSSSLYRGFDLDVDVSASNTEGEVKITVPFYSKSQKREKEIQRKDFLDKGAELLKDLRIDAGRIEILKEKEIILRTIMAEEGVKSIEAYHTAKEERIIMEAKIVEIIRKLEAMLL